MQLKCFANIGILNWFVFQAQTRETLNKYQATKSNFVLFLFISLWHMASYKNKLYPISTNYVKENIEHKNTFLISYINLFWQYLLKVWEHWGIGSNYNWHF